MHSVLNRLKIFEPVEGIIQGSQGSDLGPLRFSAVKRSKIISLFIVSLILCSVVNQILTFTNQLPRKVVFKSAEQSEVRRT